MASSKINDIDLKKQFLQCLNQPDRCEQFYVYMKGEQLAYVLEFYLACDGLRNLLDDTSKQGAIIELIYKHYLAPGKDLSCSLLTTKFSLTNEQILSIRQRLLKQEFHLKFYEQAQDYVLKYMLQMCYRKYLVEHEHIDDEQIARCSLTYSSMHRRAMSTRRKEAFEQFKHKSMHRSLK
jgi:hypothetical protein